MREKVAIVGAAARLPGAPDLDAYWRLLIAGGDAVTEVPDGRWTKALFHHPDPGHPGTSYTWAAGVLDDIAGFDAAFFGVSPREAEQVDPQQRLLLELTWEAMEDAGIPASRLAGTGAGVYIGASGTEYGNLSIPDPAAGNAYLMTGTTTGVAANRLSYVFDLRGPSFIVDTACSSSLVALHQACRALQSGEAPLAVAGGVNMLLTPFPFMGFCAASMLSPDGRCFAFDARANGYVRAEGAGVVILKRLSDALADGDPIRAVIDAAALNSDGRTMGLSLPSGDAQERLLRQVYGEAGIDPDALGFIEAHGTGTAAGDPIELGALGRALGSRRSRPLPIGSAKTNVGHLEVASGMAGLFKAMLALEHRLLPPSRNFETPNPDIPFAELNLEVATAPRPLGDGELYAGVNSFGFGGTNAHAILGAAPRTAEPPLAAVATALPPLLISARSEEALRDLARTWSERLAQAPAATAAADIRGAARHRDHHRHRAFAWGATPADLAAALRSPEVEHLRGGYADGRAAAGGLAFVFTGNGSQWPGMAREALGHSPAFAAAVAEVDALLAPLLGWSLAQRLAADEPAEGLARTDVAQPLLFAVQVGVVRALEAAGVRPQSVTGHSVGEIAAAWAAGALPLHAACRVVAARSRQQQRTAGAGRMAALALGPDATLAAIASVDDRLELAAVNSASATTVSGPADAIARLVEAAAAEGWRCTPLALDYAFHSRAMEPIRADLLSDLAGLSPGPAALARFVSTVEGRGLEGEALGPDYWWRNIREPVRFREAVDALASEGARVFVEVGPHAILQSYVREQLKAADVEGRVLATLAKRSPSRDPFPAIAARLYAAGVDLSGAPAFAGPAARRGLPGHPWRREPFWAPRTSERRPVIDPVEEHPLLGFRDDPEGRSWTQSLDVRRFPWLADHALEGAPLLPATAFAELALAAAHARLPDAASLEVGDLEILRALALEPGRPRRMRVRLHDDLRVEIESRNRLGDEPWTLHAVGRVGQGAGTAPADEAPRGAPERIVQGGDLYAAARTLGLDYGPRFQVVSHIETFAHGAARVTFGQAARDAAAPGLLVSPELFDGALQGFIGLLAPGMAGGGGESLLPSRFGKIRAFAPFGRRPAFARLSVGRPGVRTVRGAAILFDAEGAAVAEARDCVFQRVRLSRAGDPAERTFRFERAPAPLSEVAPDAAADPAEWVRAAELTAAAPDETGPLLEAYLVAGVHEAIAGLVGAEPFSVQGLRRRGLPAPEAGSLFFAGLELLARHGLAREGDGLWSVGAEHGFGDRASVWRTLLAEAPSLVAELALAADTVASLPRLFRAGPEGIPVAAATLDHMLHGSPAARAAQDALVRTAMIAAETWPTSRPLRVLEIGAGGGELTQVMRRALGGRTCDLRYTASDPSPEAASRLALRLDGRGGAAVVAWDPREGAVAPGGPYDLIVSGSALSRLQLDEAALSAAARSLTPGGALLAVEPLPSPHLDLVLGRRADWWSRSAAPEFPVSPLRRAEAWTALLTHSGFHAEASHAVGSQPWSSVLLAARRSTAAVAPAARPQAPAVQLVGSTSDPLAAELSRRLQTPLADALAPPCDRADVVVAPHGAVVADRLNAVLDVVRALGDGPARLTVVTRGADLDPAEAAVAGLVRTLANEHPELEPRRVDLAPDLSPAVAADRLVQELPRTDDETEVVWTAGGRFAPRLRRGPSAVDPGPGRRELAVGRPGLLSSLGWAAAPARAPGPGEVALTVEASGLNFRDVMWAQGLLPEEALQDGFAGATLGLECAGVVRAVGPDVQGLAPGDRVMAFAPAAHATEAVTAAHAVVRIPDTMSFAEASTVPVAYLTVVYALGRVAQLAAGERVLIHGGAGGVGLAAIQYAQARGAVVFATAGSDLKREVLRELGVDHVLDSRSLAFAEDILRLTGGEGVDVVLNSLAGEAMERSLGLLKPFGRFLELGKRDFFENTRVGLRPLRNNVAYHAIDADRLPLARPKLAAELLEETVRLMAEGVLSPLPHRVFARSDAEAAFRLMQGAGHIGKIVLEPDAVGPAPAPAARAFAVRADRTYLVTGGLAGFGLAAARWLAARGARHLALVGRRGAETPGAAEALAELAAEGVDARALAADVADERALARALGALRAGMPPLAGVVHAAMVLDDGLLRETDAARLDAVLAPKLEGALNLDRLTRGDPVELFVLFSSATTVLGAPGQGAYVAANMALEALARRRESEGRPALAVGWGPIGDAGVLARETTARDALERRLAAVPLAAAEALDALPELWASHAPVAAFAAVHWDQARRRLPVLSRPMFADVATAEAAEEADLAGRLAGLPPAAAKALIVEVLVEEIARILSSSPDRVDVRRPLSELGMDSLMGVELRMTLESRLRISLPLLSLSDTTTVTALASRIAASVGTAAVAQDGAAMADAVLRHEGDAGSGAGSGAAAR